MIYEIEYFRWKKGATTETEVVRREKHGFPSLDAAEDWGRTNTWTIDDANGVDGFYVLQGGKRVGTITIEGRNSR